MFNKLFNNKGSSLIGAIVVMTLLGAAATSLTTLNSTDAVSSQKNTNFTRARAVGNAGLQKAIKSIENGNSPNAIDVPFGGSNGKFSIYSDYISNRVTVVSSAGESKSTQSINVNFAKDCVDLIVGGDYAEENILENIILRKTCNNKAIVDKLYFTWNMSDCSLNTECDGSISEPEIINNDKIPPTDMIWICHHPNGNSENAQTITISPFDWNIYQHYEGNFIGKCEDDESTRPPEGQIYVCHYPLGNPENYHTLTVSPNAWRGHRHHPGDFIGRCEDLESELNIETCLSTNESTDALNTCSENDGGLTLTQIDIQNNTVFLAGSIPYPDSQATFSGDVTNIADTVLTQNGDYTIRTIFSDLLTPGTWFVLTAEFRDGSFLTKEFKLGNEGGIEENNTNSNNGINDINNGIISVDSGNQVDLTVLGSAISCGIDGPEVNMRVKLCTNDVCENLWDFEDVDGGETYSTITNQTDNNYKISIQADLDSCANFMRTIDSTNTIQFKTLRNGEQAPPLSGFGGQMSIQDFLVNYLDNNGKVVLKDNEIIMLVEAGINLVNDPSSLNADYQDLVLLMKVTETTQ